MRTGTGKQIMLTSPTGFLEAMAIHITWDASDIAANIRKLLNIPEWQQVLMQRAG
jgi:hypothetical protein